MNTISPEYIEDNTVHMRICALIPDEVPHAGELRSLLNLHLTRLPQRFQTSSVYHEPLDLREPSVTNEQLQGLLKKIIKDKRLEDWPVPAYLASLGKLNDANRSIIFSWFAYNAHILLTLQRMGDRSTQIRLLCARFRLAITHPKKHAWLLQWLPAPERLATWMDLGRALEQVEIQLSQRNADAVQVFESDVGHFTQALPDSAERRMAEIRLAYMSAIRNKPKIIRTGVRGSTGKRVRSIEIDNHRLPMDHRGENDPVELITFKPEFLLDDIAPEEQIFDDMGDRWVDSKKPPPAVISDSPAAQVFTIKNQAAHISRRGFEFVTDMRNLPIDHVQAVLQHLYIGVEQGRALDSLLLLSLLTGTRSSQLENTTQLFTQNRIFFSEKMRCWLWVVRLTLPKFNEKIDQRLLNSSAQALALVLPKQLVDPLNEHIGVDLTQDDFNQRINEIKKTLKIPLLTAGRLASALHTIIRRHTGNRLVSDILCGLDARHSAAMYYTSIQWQQAHQIYRQAIEQMAAGSSLNLDYLDVMFDAKSSGSASAVTLGVAKRYFARLLEPCNQPGTLIERHNAYTVWLWHIILLLTSIRPVDHAPGMLDCIDLDEGLIWVADKEGTHSSGDGGRIIPLCDFLIQALRAYLSHLKFLQQKLGVITEELGQIIPAIQSAEFPLLTLHTDKGWKPVTPGMIQQQVAHLPWLPSNWTRHFGRSFMLCRLPDYLIDTVFGHEQPDQEALNSFSSFNFQDLKTIAAQYDLMATELDLTAPNAWREFIDG